MPVQMDRWIAGVPDRRMDGRMYDSCETILYKVFPKVEFNKDSSRDFTHGNDQLLYLKISYRSIFLLLHGRGAAVIDAISREIPAEAGRHLAEFGCSELAGR